MERYTRYAGLAVLLLGGAVSVQADAYDYVIAGAGTAGLVLANRLSEDPKVTVAVIEPGPDVRNDPAVQATVSDFYNFNTTINWQYPTVPQSHIGGRSLSYRAGKAIGGSSAINGMNYVRGDKAQYDAWEELGNKGWNWESVFSYIKRGEEFIAPTRAQRQAGASYEPAAHGADGPLTVSFPWALSNGSYWKAGSETWAKLGFPARKDINDGDARGFGLTPMTVDRDADNRESAARAYYEPVDSRKNLRIIQGTVRRIVWAKDGSNGEAVADGFEYVDASGKLVRTQAKKEVILSAGSFRSPLILEGSGVGNPKILGKLGVEVKAALPGVGEAMQDHNGLAGFYATKAPIAGFTPLATMPTVHDVFGAATAAAAAASRGRLAAWARAASEASGGALGAPALERRFRLQHDLLFARNATVAELFPSSGPQSVAVQYWISMPFSYGSVHLGAVDRPDEPVVDNRVMAVDFDVAMLTAVGRLSRKAYTTSPLRDLFTAPDEVGLPANATDAQWESFVKENVQNVFHVIGTCSMLPKDMDGVVDAELRVYGTKNVRVVDASVIPMQISGHTTAPLYGVAEKAADLIKKGGK